MISCDDALTQIKVVFFRLIGILISFGYFPMSNW